MKKTVLLIFLTLVFKSAIAECAMSGMQFFPEQKQISLNSMFIIQGYSFSEKTINSFKNRTIYLESENGESIKLILQEVLKGQMYLTQAIFKPEKELKQNTTYFLKYSEQTEKESNEMTKWNPRTEKKEKVYWRTTEKKSITPLNENLKVQYNNSEVIYYGCGPSANAIFNVTNKLDSEIWYKTEFIDLVTNNKTIFYIKEWNGKLNVGHGMCGGAFTYRNKGKYKVRFTPMNIDGKPLKHTEWIIYDSPFVNNKNPF